MRPTGNIFQKTAHLSSLVGTNATCCWLSWHVLPILDMVFWRSEGEKGWISWENPNNNKTKTGRYTWNHLSGFKVSSSVLEITGVELLLRAEKSKEIIYFLKKKTDWFDLPLPKCLRWHITVSAPPQHALSFTKETLGWLPISQFIRVRWPTSFFSPFSPLTLSHTVCVCVWSIVPPPFSYFHHPLPSSLPHPNPS